MNLSWTEALLEMMQGKRVTHDLFLTGEWLASDSFGRILTDETGKVFSTISFTAAREENYWRQDWRILD